MTLGITILMIAAVASQNSLLLLVAEEESVQQRFREVSGLKLAGEEAIKYQSLKLPGFSLG
jgi:hypothetical protein